MKRIILHGHLKKLHPEPIEVAAETVAEALSSLKFIPELQPVDGNPWPVTIQGINSQTQLFTPTDMEEIHVYPRTGGGGGRGGLLQILLGVTLVAVSFFLPTLAPALLAAMPSVQGALFMTGAMMVLGGIIQMLTPVPETDSTEGSLYLGAGVNTVRIGTRIPILYGTRKIGGHYLSFDVDAKDIALEGDPNEETEGRRNYFKYDFTQQPTVVGPDGVSRSLVPYRAVYASATPSSMNIPVQA